MQFGDGNAKKKEGHQNSKHQFLTDVNTYGNNTLNGAEWESESPTL